MKPTLLIQAANLEPLWDYLQMAPDSTEQPLWQAYERLDVGVLKQSDELAEAVAHLTAAGTQPSTITAYHLLGHPDADLQRKLNRSLIPA